MHCDHREQYKLFWEYYNGYLAEIDRRKEKLMGSGADTVRGTTGANDIQVGGDHYKTKGKTQHWDIVVEHELNYFEAQITRYVMRCRRKKNMLEDLRKARHYIDKYAELVEQGLIEDPTVQTPKQKYDENMKRCGAATESPAFLASTI